MTEIDYGRLGLFFGTLIALAIADPPELSREFAREDTAGSESKPTVTPETES